jgi:putative transcriptional regulator
MALPSKSEALISLGSRIKAIRKEKGMSQLDLAVSVNKDYQSIQRLERGAINPSYFYLLEICEGLRIKLSDL